jgi:protein-S-isoprenylcysteine O-methyltransferase Ste14
MGTIALALYVVWAILAFGWRTVVQHRRTGDTGLRLHAEVNTPQWWAKIGFVIAIVIGCAAPIAAVAGLGNLHVLDRRWLQLAGVLVTVIGIALTIVAQFAMADSWRIGVDPTERTQLVTAGPFAVVRNPIFTAMFVTATGLSMTIPNVISVVGLVALIVALEVQVRLVEEPYLLTAQGDAYRAYAGSVGRFAPGVGRIPLDGS